MAYDALLRYAAGTVQFVFRRVGLAASPQDCGRLIVREPPPPPPPRRCCNCTTLPFARAIPILLVVEASSPPKRALEAWRGLWPTKSKSKSKKKERKKENAARKKQPSRTRNTKKHGLLINTRNTQEPQRQETETRPILTSTTQRYMCKKLQALRYPTYSRLCLV